MATTAEAAEILEISPSYVKRLIKQGRLPATRKHGRRGNKGKGILHIDDEVLAKFAIEFKQQPRKRGRPRKPVDQVLREKGL